MLEKVGLMLSAVQSSVSFLRPTSSELIRSLNENPELKELKFLPLCLKKMEKEDFRTAWLASISEDARYLKTEDKALLVSFGEFFGTTDAEGQIANCRLHSELVSEKLRQARDMQNRYAALSCGMGIICGIGIVIVLI